MELEGKRVLLSGATGGLGNAIAQELAENGENLVLSSRREQELGELGLPSGWRATTRGGRRRPRQGRGGVEARC